MKNLNRKKSLGRVVLFYIATVFLGLVSFHSYSQTTQPPAQTTPPANQIPRTPPESQPSQTYPGQKQIRKDTVIHLKKDTSHVRPDSVKRIPPPRINIKTNDRFKLD
jgi:hypothetical protein